LLGTTVGLAGCQGAGAFAQISEKINQISDNQTQILTRLDGLEAKIQEAAKQAPARGQQRNKGPQPGKPDPKATYKVAVTDTDRQKGPKDAKITLVEWSDFQ
jgi:outer membrane murein-binding lipoprotein Lpp